jgi:nucleoside-diphosphate-sugar epimerase
MRLRVIALPGTGEIQGLPRQTGDVSRTWADIEAARAAIGYAPQTALEQGIACFADWLRSRS